MLHQGSEVVARFRLHLRCDNCLRERSATLEVPDVDEAPREVDELVDSALLANQRPVCICGEVITRLVGIIKLDLDE